MKVIDPGHTYDLQTLDGDGASQRLQFVKRCDHHRPWRFPGNTSAYPGTTLQNVIRALLDRFRYLNNQIWAIENVFCIWFLLATIWLLEFRAARRHGMRYFHSPGFAANHPMCPKCGHTQCEHAQ